MKRVASGVVGGHTLCIFYDTRVSKTNSWKSNSLFLKSNELIFLN